MARCWTRNSKRNNACTGAWVAGVAAITAVAAAIWRRRAKDAPLATTDADKVGSRPHTDYDAAAEIGRKSGGEVFDD